MKLNFSKRLKKFLENTKNEYIKSIAENVFSEYKSVNPNTISFFNFETAVFEKFFNDAIVISDPEVNKFLVAEKNFHNLWNNLGVKKLWNIINEDANIVKNPIHQYKLQSFSWYLNEPEWKIIEQAIDTFSGFLFSERIKHNYNILLENLDKNIKFIKLLKIYEQGSKNNIYFSLIEEDLENYIIYREPSYAKNIVNKLTNYSNDFIVKNIIDILQESEKLDTTFVDDDFIVKRLYAPLIKEGENEYFSLYGKGYIKNENKIFEFLSDTYKEFKKEFFDISLILNDERITKIEENCMKFYFLDKKYVLESSGLIEINGKKFKLEDIDYHNNIFNILNNKDMYFFENIKNINYYKDKIYELGFAVSVSNKNIPNKRLDLFILGENKYINIADLDKGIDIFISEMNDVQFRNKILEEIGFDVLKIEKNLVVESAKENNLRNELSELVENIEYIEKKLDEIMSNIKLDKSNKKISSLISILEEELLDQRKKYFEVKSKLESLLNVNISESYFPNDIVECDGVEYVVLSYMANTDTCLLKKVDDSEVLEKPCSELKLVKSANKISGKLKPEIQIDNQNPQNSVAYKLF